VELLVAIAASGEVARVEVAASSGFEDLDAAAVEAVRAWRFAPALVDGVPVADFVRLRVRFRLEGGIPGPDGGPSPAGDAPGTRG
jgi:protein TonB